VSLARKRRKLLALRRADAREVARLRKQGREPRLSPALNERAMRLASRHWWWPV